MIIPSNFIPMYKFLRVLKDDVFEVYFDEEEYDRVDTQDDAFDSFVVEQISDILSCVTGGKNSSPDIVITDGDWDAIKTDKQMLILPAVGIENKVVRKNPPANLRLASLDYNTTPPTPFMKVMRGGTEGYVEACYLFGILSEKNRDGERRLESACLVPGEMLNETMELYNKITGTRSKEIGLGSYKDLVNRNRPMVVGPNPLSCEELLGKFTFFHPNSDLFAPASDTVRSKWKRIGFMTRKEKNWYCYSTSDQDSVGELTIHVGKSTTRTSSRGLVEIPIR